MHMSVIRFCFAAKWPHDLRQNDPTICGKLVCILRQNAMRFAANHTPFCGKMQDALPQITN